MPPSNQEEPAPTDAEADADAALVTRTLLGDTRAFELLMRRNNQRLYRCVRAIFRDEAEVEDVMQQAYEPTKRRRSMMIVRIRYAVATLALVGTACGGGASEQPRAAAPSAAAAAPETFAQQVTEGQALYASHCARCHGDHGEGGKGPRLVGLAEGALPLDPPPNAKFRKTQFKTVGDVAAFVVKAMPADAPGSLGEPAYWDILAFDLKANGIDLGDKKLDAAVAANLVIPRK